jgi:hypothetical protein
MERAVSKLREGEITGFEPVARCVTPELAYVGWCIATRAR